MFILEYMDISNIKALSDSHFHILEMIKKDIDMDHFFDLWKKNSGEYLIDVGINELNFQKRLNYSLKRDYIYFTAGIHPNYCKDDIHRRMKLIEQQLGNSRVIAVGETGLDYYWDTVDKDVQKDFFIKHIELGIKYNLPIIVHNRDACRDIIAILREYKGKAKGVIHCFSSTTKYLNQFIELGFYISFAGNVTYNKNIALQESLLSTPINRLLIETDSPYLSPQKVRGKINTPGNIGHTLDFIAEKKEICRAELTNTIRTNLLNIFNLRGRCE